MKFFLTLVVSLFTVLSYSQCVNDNAFGLDATPGCPGTMTVTGVNGGSYYTVNVVAGNTYTFSTCGNTAFDTQITVLDGATVLGYNDDDCGLQSTVTWVATFTGTIDVLVDEFNCSNTGIGAELAVTCALPVQNGTGCNTNTTICTPGTAGPFNFSTPGDPVGSCLNWIGLSYAYIVLYITQSGPLELTIDGDAATGFLDVAIFDVPNGVDPCVAQLNLMNEIGCNYATASSGCNQFGLTGPCASTVPAPNVVAGDVLFIVVENWSNQSTTFTMDLGAPPAAQTGPPDATVTAAGPFCDTDAPIQLSAVDMGGTWTGTGVSPSGLFDPAAAGPGTYVIDYTIGSVPCDDQGQTTITVNDCSSPCYFDWMSTNTGACETGSVFEVSGDFSFLNNPGTGTITVEVTNASGTWTQTFFPPFVDGQLYNYSIFADADGSPATVTITFSDDVTCFVDQAIVSPASCDCAAEIGTFTVASTGNVVGNDVTLCFGNTLDITTNGDWVAPGEATNPPGPIYDPGVTWLVYSCPPSVALVPDPLNAIPDDPCIIGIVSNFDLNEIDDQWWINNYPGVFTDNIVYFVPITMYSIATGTYSYVNTTMPCYELGAPYAVQYLPEIIELSVEDCTAGTVSTTVSGGFPAIDGSNFTGTNLTPASASFLVGTVGNGGTIIVTGLVDGDAYSYDIVDANGCPVTITGTFVGLEDPAFTYPSIAYCQDEPNPSPTITGDPGGTFTAPAGVSINAATGVINLTASTAGGPYTITYTTPDAVCFDQATFDITINPLPIVDGNDEIICVGDMVTLNGTGADTYVWDAPVLDGIPFSPGATTTYNVTGTITATGCTNVGNATVTVNPLDVATFTTTDFCEGSASPGATITGTPGGIFVFNPLPGDGATVNAASGSISNGVGGTTYTLEYTTLGACPASSTQTVTVNALPPVDVPDYSVCVGGTITLTATGAVTYTWSPGTDLSATTGTSVDFTAGTANTYTVTGTDGNGCVNTDLTTVTVIPNAPINAGPDVTICDGDIATLTATGGVTYNWQAPIGAAGAVQNISPAITTTYTVDGVDAAGCLGTDQVTISVDPIPTVNAVADEVLCANTATTTVTFTGSVAGTTYDWTNDNTSIGLAAAGAGNIASFTATNTGTVSEVATITITPTANGCVGSPITFTITVDPIPTVNIVLDETICANTSTTAVNFSGNVPGTTYDWTNDDASIGLAAAGSGDIASFTGINAGATSVTSTITVTPTANGCVGTPIVFTITIDPIPTVDPIADQVLCAALNTNAVNYTGAVAGTTYDWTNDNTSIGLAAAGSGDIASFTATNITAVTEVATITITPTVNGCVGTPITFTITVDPIPTVDPILDEVLCANETTTAVVYTGSTAGTTYDWTNDNTSIGLAAAGSGNIASFTAINAGATTVVSTITVTPSANGCIGLPETYTITVNPIPTVNPIADQILCAALNTAAVNYTGAVAGTTYDWTNDNTSIGLAAAGTGDIASFTTTNVTAASEVATITITPTINGCVGTPITFTITVDPIPSVDPIVDQLLCAGDPVAAINYTGNVAGAVYDWTNDNISIGLAAAGSGNIASFTAVNAGPATEVSTITVTPTANGCAGIPETFTITINPLPTATIAGSVDVCEGDAAPTVTFTGANGTAPYTFTYNINGGANQTLVSVGNTATVTVPTTPIGAYNYNLVSVEDASATACTQAQVGTATINVNPNPLPVINGATEYCTGTFSTLSTTIAYTTYLWSTGATSPTVDVTDADNPITVTVTNAFGCSATSAIFTVIENTVITYNSTETICQGGGVLIHGNNETVAGVYTQTFILPTGCDSTSNVTLVVNPLPIIDAGLDQALCDTDPITLNATGAPNIVWDVAGVANGVPFTQPVGTVTYTATGTDINGCVNTDQMDVVVNPLPTATIAGTVNVCVGDVDPVVTFTGANGTSPYTFTYTLNGGATQTITSVGNIATITVSTATAGTSSYDLVSVQDASSTTCSQVQVGNATVVVNPLPTATIAGTINVCEGDPSQTITFTGANGTSPYTFTYTLNGGVNQTIVSTGNIATITVATSVVGTFSYDLVSVQDASSTTCSQVQVGNATVVVNPLPTATIAGTIDVCVGDTDPIVTFTGANGTSPYTFTYNLNNGPNLTITSVGNIATITVSTAVDGTWSYNLVSVEDASSTACTQAQVGNATVVVNPLPTATIAGSIDVCLGDVDPIITFTGADGTAPYTFTYNINGGANITVVSVGNTATVTAPTGVAGTFDYNLVSVQDASTTTCSQVQVGTATVIVNPLPTATIAGTIDVCIGAIAPTITFTGANGTAPYTFTYNINGGASMTVVSVGNTATIAAPTGVAGTFDYNLISVQDASSTACSQAQVGVATVIVNPAPTAVISGTVDVCEGDTDPVITFTGANGTAPYTFTYNINGGANQTIVSVGNIATIVVSTAIPGTFAYNLVSVEDASSTACNQAQVLTATIIVNALPTASIAGTIDVCVDDTDPTITFTGANGIAPYTFTYNINGGANMTVVSVGNTATLTAPTNVDGTFNYNLVSVQDASSTTCSQAQIDIVTVIVNPLPTATVAGTIALCIGEPDPTITFTGANGTAPYTFTYNLNGGANQTIVSIGNTATITVSTAIAGTFDYNLISVQDASSTSCSQAQIGTATVVINPLPVVFAGNDFTICEGDQAVLTASGAQSYVWDNGVFDGVLFTPSNTNDYIVTGTDANGCENTDVVTVIVEPLPLVSFTADVTSGCAPLTVTFTNTTPGNLTDCIWTLSNGTVLNGCGSVTTTFPSGGLFDVTLTTTSANGCSNSETYVDYIYVEDLPIASFSPSSSVLSQLNTLVNFNNTSVGAVNYVWDFGDNSPNSIVENPSHTFPDESQGGYVVELIAYSSLGCTDTAYVTIIVNEELIFYVPNTFTPDGDSFNEYFQAIFTSGYDPYDFELLIFNRWGEIIWESHDDSVGWNGTYGGKLVQDGTYTWKIQFKTTQTDERVMVVGHVNVIR